MSILSSPNTSLLTTTMLVGAGSFRERDLVSNPSDPWGNAWGSFQARQNRYAFFWAVHENNVYRKVHLYAEGLRDDFDLYPAIRSIFGPGYRSGEFWAEHLMGGRLDPKAGDGSIVPTAIPIKISDEAGKQSSAGPGGGAQSGEPEPDRASWLRPAIARLWQDSNWQATKDIWTRFGAVLGDVALVAHDDARRRKVYLRVVHPRTIQNLQKDPQGNVKGYTLAYMRDDPSDINPLGATRQCLYQEVADRVGGSLRYRTFKDGEPWDWEDYPDEDDRPSDPVVEWTEPYDFVPMVFTQHRDMGLGWGWSELQADLSKLLELDDVAAKTSDYVRKVVDAPWLITGAAADQVTVKYVLGDDEDADTEFGRSRTPMVFCVNPQAKAQALIAPLSISEASGYVMRILAELERDHPELSGDVATSSGDASGRALRVAREKLEASVVARRAAYDDGLIRIIQMALTIGRIKNYPGYEDIPERAYQASLLAFTVGERPVFNLNVMDRIEEQQAKANVDAARASTLSTLRQSGVALSSAMRLAGYSEVEIDDAVKESKAEEVRMLGLKRRQLQMEAEAKAMAGAAQGTPPGGGGPGGAPAVPLAAGGKELASTTATAATNSEAQAA
jgi:hypothetical protein